MSGLKKATTHYALTVAGLCLVFPHDSISQVSIVDDIHPESNVRGALGTLMHDKHDWPVFSLSARLEPIPDLLVQSRFCVAFGSAFASHRFALSCEEITAIALDSFEILKPVPPCMKTEPTPVSMLFMLGDKAALLCTANSMAAFLYGGAA